MILVDTNILIAIIRGADASKLTTLLQQHDGVICGVVRAELLHGARSDDEWRNALAVLNALPCVSTFETIWDQVGDNLRTLRNHGVAVPFPDAVMARVAIANNLELWTRDAHFSQMQRALPLPLTAPL